MLDMNTDDDFNIAEYLKSRMIGVRDLIGTKIQSSLNDTLVEFVIYNYFKPQSVWEFGAGTGSWAIVMNYLGTHPAVFSMTENFAFITVEHLKKYKTKNQFWPCNLQELTSHIDQSNWQLGVSMDYQIYTTDVCHFLNTIDTPFDLVRIDCDLEMPYETIDYILDHSSNNLIIISDDVAPNVCLNRLMMLQEQVAKGKLKIFWTGESSAAWCKPDMDIGPFLEHMKIYKAGFKEMFVLDNYKFFGIQQQHLITRD